LCPPLSGGFSATKIAVLGEDPSARQGFEAWLHRRLVAIAEHPRRTAATPVRALASAAPAARRRRRPLRATAKQYVTGQFAQAQAFLTWLHQHGIDLGAVAQADVQTWYASHRVHQSACITVVWSRRPNAFRGDLRAGAVRDAIWPAASRGGQ
jgi:hypothetical protein